MSRHVLALAGGVGGAKLALGLSRVLAPEELTIVVNTGDDEVFHGLNVSPDLDTMMYALAGLTNVDTGWGVTGDTFSVLQMLGRYGAETWFNLGDIDIATHIRRTELLRRGWSLSEVTQELCKRLGIQHNIVPMSDGPVRTIVETAEGALSFQDYFVRHQCQPVATGIRFETDQSSGPSSGFADALGAATALVYCPSNPFLSIAPILAVSGVRNCIEALQVPRVAISPIVGGEALRGPAAKLLVELGHEVSCLGIARQYIGLCDVFVIDEVDRDLADDIGSLGMHVEAASTIMTTDDDKVRLAIQICSMLEFSAHPV